MSQTLIGILLVVAR